MVIIQCLVLTHIVYSQDTIKYQKTDHLFKMAGIPMYGGWDLEMNYEINGKGETVSDTSYTIVVRSIAYTQIDELFTMLPSCNLDELKKFFQNLDDKLKNQPDKTNITIGDYSYDKQGKIIILTNLSTGRNDSYTWYTSAISIKANKILQSIQ